MNWYLQNGKDSDVVFSTRIRYARNLKNYKFNIKNKKEAMELENEIKSRLPSIGYGLKFFKVQDMDELTRLSLLEKNIISAECAIDKNKIGSLLINEEENISIMINEEDHLRIQVFSSGFDLENTFNLAKEIDEKFDENFNIAKSQKYGYLTACPTNVGTGLRVSVMVHLPALAKTGNLRKMFDVIGKFGVNIRGIHGEQSKSQGYIYQISNKQTIGLSEETIMKNLKVIIEKVIDNEREARKILAKNQVELEDEVYRSFGILKFCKKISGEEMAKLLSDVKLGTDLGIIKETDDTKVLKLYLYSKSGNLQKYVGQKLETYDRDIKRAEIIKQIIKGE